ncbi:MAG: calcium-binding protein [Cyanobacteria bacterium P01_A01_bin.84]
MTRNYDASSFANRFKNLDSLQSAKLSQALTEITNRFSLDDGSFTVAGKTASDIVVENFLDNKNVTNEQIIQASKLTLDDFYQPEREAITSKFPNYQNNPVHRVSILVNSIISGLDPIAASRNLPGHGFTGTPGKLIANVEDDALALGTIVHDNTSYIDDAFSRKRIRLKEDEIVDEDLENVESLNKTVFGIESLILSAGAMAIDAFISSSIDVIPDRDEILDFLGVDSITLIDQEIALIQTVTNLGSVGANLGTKLAFFYGDEDLASQLVTQAAGKTLGGFLGDSIVYTNFDVNLPSRALYGRFINDFRSTAVGIINSSISQALNKTLDIEDPLGQLVVSNLTSAVTEAIGSELVLDVFNIDIATAETYLGLDPTNTRLGLSFDSINGEILNGLWPGFQNFLSSQLFQYIDDVWTDVSLNNQGAAFGGIIGSLIAPGIGSFVGQLVGGLIFDNLQNEDPRAYFAVTLDDNTSLIANKFNFEADDGMVDLAAQMGESVKDTIGLIVSTVGGTPTFIQPYEYGHFEEKLVYIPLGSDRVEFDDFEEAIRSGIINQIKTLEFDGGDSYLKFLISQPDYDPSLNALFEDLGVAQEYSNHKEDPFLYGQTVINIEDPEAQEFLLEDWNRVRDRARELGLYDAPFNDGGEFIPGTNGDEDLDGDIGDDFLYGVSGVDILSGGDGNDTIQGSLAGIGSFYFGEDGTDSLVLDLSDYLPADFDDSADSKQGIEISHNPLSFGREFIENFDSILFQYNGIEILNAIGTDFNDRFETDIDSSVIDAGAGIDELSLDWRNATENIEIDLTIAEDQAIYNTTQLSNFEVIDFIITGSGNDLFTLDLDVIKNGYVEGEIDAVVGGDGEDIIAWDLSEYNPDDFAVTAGTNQGLVIEFSPNAFGSEYIESFDGTLLFRFNDIERVEAIGTDFNDRFDTDSDRSIVDAGEGIDELRLDWRTATQDIEIDLTIAEDQAIYNTTQLSNFEAVDFIITGSGNDLFKLDYSVIQDSYAEGELSIINGGEGINSLFWDLSEYNPDDFDATEGTTEGLNIELFSNRFGNHYVSNSQGLLFGYGDILRIDVVGTKFDDTYELDEGSTGSIIEDQGGVDTLSIGDLPFTINEDTIIQRFSRVDNNLIIVLNEEIANDMTNIIEIKNFFSDDDNAGTGFIETINNFSSNEILNLVTEIIQNIAGTDDDDRLLGSQGKDIINGLEGNDTIRGLGGNDILNGDDGNDNLKGGAGNDTIDGGEGIDRIREAGDFDLILTDTQLTGHEVDVISNIERGTLIGGDSDNKLDASEFSGRVNFRGKGGADVLIGGNNIDTAIYIDSDEGVSINLATNTATGGDAAGDTLVSIENLIGSEFDDNLTGNNKNNVLRGEAGNDTIDGGEGIDRIREAGDFDLILTDTQLTGNGVDVISNIERGALIGGDSNNTLDASEFSGRVNFRGKGGADILIGGDNINTAIYSDSDEGVSINLATNTATGGDAEGDSLISIENLIGSGFDDNLIGNDENNRLRGGAGNDTIDGGEGIDQLFGNEGSDIFVLRIKDGRSTIHDFVDGTDFLRLSNEISFEELLITQSGSDVKINIQDSNQLLVTLKNVDAELIEFSDFV